MDADRRFVDPLSAAYAAMGRGAWEEARARFVLALSREETPAALEGLSLTAMQLGDADTTFVARERAYWLYQERGDRHAAARVAASLVRDASAFPEDRSGTNRWLHRAQQLLDEVESGLQPAWINVNEASLWLLLRNEIGRARQVGTDAAAFGRALEPRDRETEGMALERPARLSAEDLAEARRPGSDARQRPTPGAAPAPLRLRARSWLGGRRGLVAATRLIAAALLVAVGWLVYREFMQRSSTTVNVSAPTTTTDPAPSPIVRLPSTPGQAASSAVAAAPSPLGPLASPAAAGPEPTTAATPEVTALSSPGAPVPSPQTPLRTVLDESFTDNQRGWPHNPQATAWFSDRTYHLFAREPGQFVAIGAPLTEPLTDVIATGSFRKIGGPPGGGYGLIVRDQGPGRRDGINQAGRYYVLEAGDRGEVGMWRRDGDRWIDLLPWTPSEVVRPGGATNQLTVQAIGDRFTFLVNGFQVADLVVDSALAEGGVGIFVGGDFNEVEVDQFLVQVPG